MTRRSAPASARAGVRARVAPSEQLQPPPLVVVVGGTMSEKTPAMSG